MTSFIERSYPFFLRFGTDCALRCGIKYVFSHVIHTYQQKGIIVKSLTAALILGLAGLLAAVYPAVAQSPETTASEVVDRETLQAFVEDARAWSETFTDPNDFTPYTIALSTEGDWNHGNTYLILMQPNGTVLFHASDPSANGKYLNDTEDARGNKVVQALIEAANASGGFVEYYWDDPAVDGDEDTPKLAYATSYISGTTGTPIILIGGYYQDVSQASFPPLDPSIVPIPEITAADVVDRETLKAYVQGAMKSFLTVVEQIGIERFLQQLDIFREEGGPWKKGSVYFFVFSTDGHVLFHAVDRSLEFSTSDLDKTDVNGVKYLRDLIRVAKEGGGFTQYNFDDPTVEGDEDTGSPKISYAELATYQGQEYIFGSGLYTGSTTAVEGQSWGHLKSDF